MNGIRLCFSFVDLAKSTGRGIGSVRLKDGSSIKMLGDPAGKSVDFFRIKHGRLLEATGYRGRDAIARAANDVGYIEENLAVIPNDAQEAWGRCFDILI